MNYGAPPRTALAAGKAFAAGVKAVPQTVITVLITAALGGAMNWNLLRLPGVVVAAAVLLGSALFSCPPMAIAGIALTRDRLMGIGHHVLSALDVLVKGINSINEGLHAHADNHTGADNKAKKDMSA